MTADPKGNPFQSFFCVAMKWFVVIVFTGGIAGHYHAPEAPMPSGEFVMAIIGGLAAATMEKIASLKLDED